MRFWLQTYDRELPLIDVINDPDASDVDMRLAMASLAQDLDGGYYDAEALADAVSHLWAEMACDIENLDSEARRELGDLLSRGGRYTNALYDEVKHLSARSAALHLHDHAQRMKHRADMVRLARDAASQAA